MHERELGSLVVAEGLVVVEMIAGDVCQQFEIEVDARHPALINPL